MSKKEDDKRYYEKNKEKLIAKNSKLTIERNYNKRNTECRYSMQEVEWWSRYQSQNGNCAICGEPMLPHGRGKDVAYVDHNHETGEVRGLIHSKCNLIIGHAEDDPQLLRLAAEYLERN